MDLIEQYRGYQKTCFVLGASGESGKALVKELLRVKPFERIVLIGRRKLDYQDYELQQLEQRVINFDRLESHKADFDGFDVGFCCLGTTREKAGSAEAYVKIDHDYVFGVAQLAKQGGTEHFHVISSMGASEHSWLLYYATKGRTDREISQLNFDRASIYRIGALMVDREESRPLEAIVRILNTQIIYPHIYVFMQRHAGLNMGREVTHHDRVFQCNIPLALYVMKPFAILAPTLITTPVDILAKAMVMNTVQDQPSGAEIVDNRRIHALAKLSPP